SDLFIHDMQTGETTRVSVASDGTQAALFGAYYPSMSADGRYVAFSGDANLVGGVDPATGLIYVGCCDAIMHDRVSGMTERVGVASDGTPANNGSTFTSLSADGRYVAFTSLAANLVPADTNSNQ